MLGPIKMAVILTSLGFPVMQDVRANRLRWPLVASYESNRCRGTAALLLFGFVSTLAAEWHNPETIGPMNLGGKVMNAIS